MHMHSTDGKETFGKMGKPYRDIRNWKEYNEELVIRGEILLRPGFRRSSYRYWRVIPEKDDVEKLKLHSV